MSIKTLVIVGFGGIGRRHADIIKTHFPSIKVITLRHKSCHDDTFESWAFQCVTSVADAVKLNPQAAIISNPASKHIKIAIEFAKKGIHLLVEKPISNTSKDVQQLIDICRQNKATLMVGYNLRFSSSLLEFKKQIHSGKIGKIYSVRSEVGQYLPDWRPNKDYRNTVSGKKEMGGGVLLELSHEIDYLLWIFGNPVWVKSHISKQSNLELNVEDQACTIFGFNREDNTDLVVSLNIDFIRQDPTRKCFAIGEKGTILWDGIKNQVDFFNPASEQWEVLFSSVEDRNTTYIEEIKSFFLSAESHTEPTITGEEGLRVVNTVESIRRSSIDNSIVFCES